MAQGSTKAPQDILSELGVDDLYNFIGVEFKATDKEVRFIVQQHDRFSPGKN